MELARNLGWQAAHKVAERHAHREVFPLRAYEQAARAGLRLAAKHGMRIGSTEAAEVAEIAQALVVIAWGRWRQGRQGAPWY
jgi:hypothetical protein